MRLGEAERHPLEDGHAVFRRDAGYLRVEEHGNPGSPEEMARYFAAIDGALVRGGVQAMLIVAQRTASDPRAPKWVGIREARWKALASCRAARIAVLVEDELGRTRVNMSAVVAKAPVRAFLTEAEAIAWLTGPPGPRAP